MTHLLEGQLRAAGFACRVEVRERLAILVPDEPGALQPVVDARAHVTRMARLAGFSHVALEPVADRAPLPGA